MKTMKTIKKVVSLLIIAALLTGCASTFGVFATAFAADIVKTGSCGENVTYTLDSDGLLTISGTGEITNYTAGIILYGDNTFRLSDEEDRSPFAMNSSIKSVIIEQGVTAVGRAAFFGCTGINAVSLAEGVKSIGTFAFYGCTGLESLILPDSLKDIGAHSFMYCTGLTGVSLPYGLQRIYGSAFLGCSGLTEISIPGSVLDVCGDSFGNCPAIERLEVYDVDENSYYYSVDNCIIYYDTVAVGCKNSIIPDDSSVTTIGEGAFYFCKELTEINIPDNVTTIEEMAFAGCSGLTYLEIPESVEYIGDTAFGGTGLKTMNIPDSVTETGDGLFYECRELENVRLPDGLTEIGYEMFRGCTALKEITIPAGVTLIEYWAFEECPGLEKIEVAAGNATYHSTGNCIIETETKTLIAGCKRSVIPDDGSVTSIGRFAFSCCSGLTCVTIPDSVTIIDEYAFYGCEELEKIWIPETTTEIGEDVFCDCENLTIHGVAGSYAQEYAEAYNIPFSTEDFNKIEEPATDEPGSGSEQNSTDNSGDQTGTNEGSGKLSFFDKLLDFLYKILTMIANIIK